MDPIITFLALLTLLVGVATAVLALRNRVAFRIAMRNVRRGRWRTVLVILGLLVGTAIISGTLTINDTVGAVNTHYAYISYGFTSEGIYNNTSTGPQVFAPFYPMSTYRLISNATSSESLIAGTTPEAISAGTAYDRTNGVPESGITIVGVDPSASSLLGSFTYDNGSKTNGPNPGGILIDDILAGNLGAAVGDRVTLYGATAVTLTVQGIVQDDTRGGFLGENTAFVTMANGQAVANVTAAFNFIAVTNVGSLTETVGHSDAVQQFLNATLPKLGPPVAGLVSVPLLQNAVNAAITSGSSIATLFLVLGLFSIIAGALLIIGIFVTLAEERKGEMGMLRAVGLTRRSLVYLYYFEGIVYAAASALVGTVVGVGVGYSLLLIYVSTIGNTTPGLAAVFQSSFTVSATSLVIAYVAGFLLTLATIAAASARVSRLNIVRAIRSIPEPPPPIRVYTYLAYLGAAALLVGGLVFGATRTGSGDESVPIIGLALVIIGGGLIASRFARNRVVFSILGVLLVAWGGTGQLHQTVLGNQHSGTIFVVFVDGILMIAGAVLLFVFNAETIAGALARLAGRTGRRVSVVRVGLAYPRRRPMRSAVNFMIFCMVIFTVVVIAAYGAAVQSGLNNLVKSESGGYTYFGVTQSSQPDLPQMVQQNMTLAPQITTVVPLIYGFVSATWSGAPPGYADSLYSGPTNASPSESLYDTNQYNFSQTQGGLTASGVWHLLATDPGVAVVDSGYQGGGSNFGANHPTFPLGTVVTLENPATKSVRNVTVVAYMAQSFVSGFWINPTTATALGYRSVSAFLITVAGSASVSTAGQDLKRAFFPLGLILYNFAQILQQVIQSTEGVIELLEVFVALGLAVGIAGMGITALRAVVERRTTIGMLRATGFTRNMILGAFLIEYSYITLLGTAVGTALAIWLYYNATAVGGGVSFGVFTIPTGTILTIVLVAYGLTILATIGPSWKAARLPPAEAVRYTE